MAEDMDYEDSVADDNNGDSQNALKKSFVKRVIFLLLPILLLLVTIIGLYVTGFADSLMNNAIKDTPEKVEEEADKGADKVFFEVPEMFINLSVKAGEKPIYFKIKVVLEMESSADMEQAELMLPRIVDSLQFYLREMRLEEVQGSIGTYRLKEEIQSRLNLILAPVKVKDVLFKEILIQ